MKELVESLIGKPHEVKLVHREDGEIIGVERCFEISVEDLKKYKSFVVTVDREPAELTIKMNGDEKFVSGATYKYFEGKDE